MTRVLIAVAGLALVTGGCVMRDRGVESAGGRSMAGHFSAKAVLRTAWVIGGIAFAIFVAFIGRAVLGA